MEIENDYYLENSPSIHEEMISDFLNSNILNDSSFLFTPKFFHETKIHHQKYFKRTYNDLMKEYQRLFHELFIKEKEEKYSILKKKYPSKLKINMNENKSDSIPENIIVIPENEKKLRKSFEITKESIDFLLNDLENLVALYKNNEDSSNVRKTLMKQMINNALQMEKTFIKYFSENKFPNKK